MAPSCDWSIVVDDPVTGEPRGLIFTSECLSEQAALDQARAILTTCRLLGTYVKPADAQPDASTGLYFFTYHFNRVQKLAAIWAYSIQDAQNTLDNMAACGNLLCYCEPET